MKKNICILFLLTVLSVGFLSAKVKLTLDVGPVYTHFSSRATANNGRTDTWSTHTGGIGVLFSAEFVKNFGVYGTTNFAFGKRLTTGWYTKNHSETDKWDADLTYAIDNQFGFFYVFHPVKNLDLSLGLGLGLGGSGENHTYDKAPVSVKVKKSQTNIGGGVNFNVSYMFTKMVGIYGGVSDTIYVPVHTKTKRTIGNKTEETSDSTTSGKLANSFSIKAGIQLVF